MQHVLVLISIIVIQAALALLHTGAKLNFSVKSAFFPLHQNSKQTAVFCPRVSYLLRRYIQGDCPQVNPLVAFDARQDEKDA